MIADEPRSSLGYLLEAALPIVAPLMTPGFLLSLLAALASGRQAPVSDERAPIAVDSRLLNLILHRCSLWCCICW